VDIPETEYPLIQSWKIDPTSPCFHISDPFDSVASPRFYHLIPGGLGSDGVLVIEREEGGIAVIKPVGRPAGDLFASFLLRNIEKETEINLWMTPKVRGLFCKSEEFLDLMKKLKKIEYVKEGGSNGPFMNRLSQKQFVLAMEFVTAISGNSITPELFHEVWNPQTLRALGAMIAVDMLLNNWDRVPVPDLWDNEGNLGNIMLFRQQQEIHEYPKSNLVVIDQTITSIRDAKKKQEYLMRVLKLTQNPSFEWISTYFQIHSGLKNPPAEVVQHVSSGFIEMVDWMRDNSDKMIKIIQDGRRWTRDIVINQTGAISYPKIVENVETQLEMDENFLIDVLLTLKNGINEEKK